MERTISSNSILGRLTYMREILTVVVKRGMVDP